MRSTENKEVLTKQTNTTRQKQRDTRYSFTKHELWQRTHNTQLQTRYRRTPLSSSNSAANKPSRVSVSVSSPRLCFAICLMKRSVWCAMDGTW